MAISAGDKPPKFRGPLAAHTCVVFVVFERARVRRRRRGEFVAVKEEFIAAWWLMFVVYL